MNDVYFQHEQRSDMNNKRNAGMSKGEIMNRLATSKEDILAASRELIKENGWAAVSIRSVAAKCSVSAGTIYNYYESKAELLGATIESVWQEIFFHPEDEQVFHDVTTCISWIYERFKYGNKRFPGFFSLHSFGFMKEGKDDGKKRMMRTWEHILNGLCEVLKNDPKIRPGVFDENFTEMQFAEILFSLMLVSVIREDYDPSSVLMLINNGSSNSSFMYSYRFLSNPYTSSGIGGTNVAVSMVHPLGPIQFCVVLI
jgi:AcrR family transcriptional regulator